MPTEEGFIGNIYDFNNLTPGDWYKLGVSDGKNGAPPVQNLDRGTGGLVYEFDGDTQNYYGTDSVENGDAIMAAKLLTHYDPKGRLVSPTAVAWLLSNWASDPQGQMAVSAVAAGRGISDPDLASSPNALALYDSPGLNESQNLQDPLLPANVDSGNARARILDPWGGPYTPYPTGLSLVRYKEGYAYGQQIRDQTARMTE
jgi:hypothetical protein